MRAWVTLLSGDGYLAGTEVLAGSLAARGTAYPLVVMVTPDVSAAARAAVARAGARVVPVEPPAVPPGMSAHYAAARFETVWSKLCAWQLDEYERVGFLDSDMLVLARIDELLELPLPDDGLAACHACTCNPLGVPTYPADWTPDRCRYGRTDVAGYFNSGLMVFRPDRGRFADMSERLAGLTDLAAYKFPEQDFLNEIHVGRWQPLPWVYNALKTIPLCHPELWDLGAVKILHFIIDKPWDHAPDADAGRFTALHRLWWRARGA